MIILSDIRLHCTVRYLPVFYADELMKIVNEQMDTGGENTNAIFITGDPVLDAALA